MPTNTKFPNVASKSIGIDWLRRSALPRAGAPPAYHPDNRLQVGGPPTQSVQGMRTAPQTAGSANPTSCVGQPPSLSAAPPVYRPDVTKLAQLRILAPLHTAGAAPVYRVLRQKDALRLAPQTPLALYRPQLDLCGQPAKPVIRTPLTLRMPVQQTCTIQRAATSAAADAIAAAPQLPPAVAVAVPPIAPAPPAPGVRVGARDFSPSDLIQHLWDESHKRDASLVWHDEYREAVAEFASHNRRFDNEIDLTIALAGFHMARLAPARAAAQEALRAAVEGEVRGQPIPQALFEAGEFLLARQFAREFTAGNPRISLTLMVKLRRVLPQWLVWRSEVYRRSAGGQNGMIYYFQVAGFTALVPPIGEWHVHWEARRQAGSPGWKRGKHGVKEPNTQAQLDQLRTILGARWGEDTATGGSWI